MASRSVSFPNANGALVTLHDDMSAEGTETLLCFPQIRDVIFERQGKKSNALNSKLVDEALNLESDHEGSALVCAGEDIEFFFLGAVVTR
jgi:hypothetical protein